ncbi:MAG: hypothetical protein ACXABY_29000 [Candidatus Thorarchaeota archaeon]|jgi:hypothetical protein
MSEVARQYNLIGETLRQGVGDLLQGQAAGKALDIQALQMGVQGEDRKFKRLMEAKRFNQEQSKIDENKARYDQARQDPTFVKEQAVAKAAMDSHNKPGTDFSLGIDTPAEKEWFDEKILPLMAKELGITRNEKGKYVDESGKVLKDGELKQNTDIAGIMVGNMDPMHHVRKHSR